MARARNRFDLLIIGDHPCAWLCATIVASRTSANVCVVTQSATPNQFRLVHVNPSFFDLDKSTASIRKSIKLSEAFGLEILSDDAQKAASYRAAKPNAFICDLAEVHAALRKLASAAGVAVLRGKDFACRSVDDATITCDLDGKPVLGSMIAYSDVPKPAELRALGLGATMNEPSARYAWCDVPARLLVPLEDKPLISMSLELRGQMRWAWLLRQSAGALAAIELPSQAGGLDVLQRLRNWCELLVQHGRLSAVPILDTKSISSMILAPAGALGCETVGNRTLLFGPAGGFFSAGCEDLYPNCWSAVCAAETFVEALHAKHAQDALHGYRARWGATLGDYLRGPQQNLKFLLPLVYRNKLMAARIAEAILSGSSVVR